MARSVLTGTRIRERREGLGLKQAELAKRVRISGSYLNLIEHNRRRIGGKLLGDIAEALGVEIATLSEGVDRSLSAPLEVAARRAGLTSAALDQVEALVSRYPDWARFLRDALTRQEALERTVNGLQDRLSHDPALSAAMHEVLTMVSAVRSTASILAQTPEIDPNWLRRFHTNIDADSRRLADGAEAMVAYFDRDVTTVETFTTPFEAVGAAFDAADHHFPQIETGGLAAIDGVLAEVPESLPGTRAMMAARLKVYARDAAALPLATLRPHLVGTQIDPLAIATSLGAPLAQVLRRLATLPADMGLPEVGLLVCDSAGAVLHRKPLAGLNLPLQGATCPLLPIFEALLRPLYPTEATLETVESASFQSWSVAEPQGALLPGAPFYLHSTMLILRATGAGAGPRRQIGPTCRVCPREGCPARREPSLLSQPPFDRSP